MTIQPTNNRILAKLHFPSAIVVLPDNVTFDPRLDDQRPRVEVLGVAENITWLKPGQFILLHPGVNALPISKEEKTIMFDAGAVLGIVTDDSIPISNN